MGHVVFDHLSLLLYAERHCYLSVSIEPPLAFPTPLQESRLVPVERETGFVVVLESAVDAASADDAIVRPPLLDVFCQHPNTNLSSTIPLYFAPNEKRPITFR